MPVFIVIIPRDVPSPMKGPRVRRWVRSEGQEGTFIRPETGVTFFLSAPWNEFIFLLFPSCSSFTSTVSNPQIEALWFYSWLCSKINWSGARRFSKLHRFPVRTQFLSPLQWDLRKIHPGFLYCSMITLLPLSVCWCICIFPSTRPLSWPPIQLLRVPKIVFTSQCFILHWAGMGGWSNIRMKYLASFLNFRFDYKQNDIKPVLISLLLSIMPIFSPAACLFAKCCLARNMFGRNNGKSLFYPNI